MAARALAQGGDYAAALKDANTALDLVQASPGSSEYNRAIILTDISEYSRQLGKLAVARDAADHALQLLAAIDDDRARGLAGEKKALAEESLGEFPAALDSYSRAISDYRKRGDDAALDVARSSLELGNLAIPAAKLETARAIVAALRQSPPADESYRISTDLLEAKLLTAEKDYAKAEKILSDVVTRNAASRPDAALIANYELADLYAENHDWARSEQIVNTLLQPQRGVATDNVFYADLHVKKGIFLAAKGEFVAADRELKTALEIGGHLFGPEHPFMARVAHAYGLAHEQIGNVALARASYEKSIRILAKSYGDGSDSVVSERGELAIFEVLYGDIDSGVRLAASNLHLAGEKARADYEIVLGYKSAKARQATEAAQHFNIGFRLSGVDGDSIGPYVVRPNIVLADVMLDSGQIEPATKIVTRLNAYVANYKVKALQRDQVAMLDARVVWARGDRVEAVSAIHALLASMELQRKQGEFSDLFGPYRDQLRRLYASSLALLGDVEGLKEEPTNAFDDLFLAAQAAQASTVASAVASAAAALSLRSGNAGSVLQEQQKLKQKRRLLSQAFDDIFLKRGTNVSLEALASEIAKTDVDIAALDQHIARDFPLIYQMTNPSPIEAERLKAVLRPDEGVLSVFVGDDSTYVWLVTRTDFLVVRRAFGESTVAKLVDAVLRSIQPTEKGLPEFNAKAAHELYSLLLNPLESKISTLKQLVYVPDISLQALPLAVLVRNAPSTSTGRPQWVGESHAISVAPAVSSLFALRSLPPATKAPKPFVGFGDPKLTGHGRTRGITLAQIYREGTEADRNALRSLPELPETVTELSRIADDLGGDPQSLYFGSRATVSNVRLAQLDNYRIVAFASHAVVAGALSKLQEPAIILTPPDRDIGDDGLLRASEIATLKLNADWVILSACNTAAPDGSSGGEGLSGLAQSFFLAGARDLMVSYWEVESDATVLLTTRTVHQLAQDPSLSKAEALRQTMVSLINDPNPELHHPAIWGAFAIVGGDENGL